MNTPRLKLVKGRKDFGYTQEELAKKVNISRAYLSNLEAGKYNPSLEVARKLSLILDMTVEELFL